MEAAEFGADVGVKVVKTVGGKQSESIGRIKRVRSEGAEEEGGKQRSESKLESWWIAGSQMRQ